MNWAAVVESLSSSSKTLNKVAKISPDDKVQIASVVSATVCSALAQAFKEGLEKDDEVPNDPETPLSGVPGFVDVGSLRVSTPSEERAVG